MPRKKWIDKSKSTTFQLVHRSQNDPKIHDASSSSMVLQKLAPTQAHKIKSRNDLENELFGVADNGGDALPNIRNNEGEAAEHGVYFDDTGYDYMQHIRDLNAGTGNGESYFVEAATKKIDRKGKGKMSLEEALMESSLQDKPSESRPSQIEPKSLVDDDLLPSERMRKGTYQDQQDVPDALAGFQPDMDPRLREVLEALEDEAYVDDSEDFLGEIAKDCTEVSLDEFEEMGFMENEIADDGWESDETEKPIKEYKTGNTISLPVLSSPDIEMSDATDHGDGDWMKEFSLFKQAEKAKEPKVKASNPEMQSTSMTATSIIDGRRKKRKGAMTSSTGYSMTSSSLSRTEGQSLLDARFDKIEEAYAEEDMDMDDGTASMVTASSLASSQAPPLATVSGFDSIMDDFLRGCSTRGKKKAKKGGYQCGIANLDEVRKELGPARVRTQKT